MSIIEKIVVFIILALLTSWPYFEKFKEYGWTRRIVFGIGILALIAFGIIDIVSTETQSDRKDLKIDTLGKSIKSIGNKIDSIGYKIDKSGRLVPKKQSNPLVINHYYNGIMIRQRHFNDPKIKKFILDSLAKNKKWPIWIQYGSTKEEHIFSDDIAQNLVKRGYTIFRNEGQKGDDYIKGYDVMVNLHRYQAYPDSMEKTWIMIRVLSGHEPF